MYELQYRTHHEMALGTRRIWSRTNLYKGKDNIVADALSCLESDDGREIFNISEYFGFDNKDLPNSMFTLHYHNIAEAQRDNPALQQKLASHKDYSIAAFCGGNKAHNLICHNKKNSCNYVSTEKNSRLVPQDLMSSRGNPN
jgi:hypothetical protein